MNLKSKFSIQSLVIILILNIILLTTIFLVIRPFFQELKSSLEPLRLNLSESNQDQYQYNVEKIYDLISQKETRFVTVLIGIGTLISILIWLALQIIGRNYFNFSGGIQRETEQKVTRKDKGVLEIPETSPAAAIQILAILQRQGRLIDFLQEDLTSYEDAQIGAAVRNIHEGCKKALTDYFKLEPIFNEQEGTEVTIQTGFDSDAIRLTGNVSGHPPFKGAVRHRGWRVLQVDLPKILGKKAQTKIVAPAEIEIGT